jgi:hypothetical protein
MKRTTKRDLAARIELMNRLGAKPSSLWKVGDWVWPYKCPRGTAATTIERIEGEIAYLKDGSSLHVTKLRTAPANGVQS